ncbi:MAG: indolepyruvate oxidoreductase subunit beta [Gammaproteobacteria bacterium]|nr:MAG: indolepyruvate oxidoreductase subunit beta [Gammaproteobacteria bacterium]
MKYDIIISGVGGQGILAIAMVLGKACIGEDLQVRQSEIHGMAQRGGAVHSHFRISDGEICSDVIPLKKADMILAMEPMEALRYIPFLKEGGKVIANVEPVVNIPNYPDLEEVKQQLENAADTFIFDGSTIAAEGGTKKALNMAMLGAASPFLPLSEETLTEAIKTQFQGKKEDLIQKNLDIFAAAREAANV